MKFSAFLIIIFALSASAQSRRVVPADPAVTTVASIADQSVKSMFDEANTYSRNKFTEFEQKKIAYSEGLRKQTQIEQKQLAAKYAGVVSQRTNIASEDLYYLGMLHWIAENLDGATAALSRYIADPSSVPDKTQTSRSVLVIISSKKRNFSEAEAKLAEYLKTGPVKLSERARMENELAKAYLSVQDFGNAATHAATAFSSTKSVLADPANRSRGLDQLIDDAMVLFEATSSGGKTVDADGAMEALRKAASEFDAPNVYFFAVDKRITYMIETGRKPKAMELFAGATVLAAKDFPDKEKENVIARLLKKREIHYKLLGETAPELGIVDRWIPGEKSTLEGLRGKVVFLDFWATWCAPCFEAFSHLSEWNAQYKADGLYVLGITRYYGMAEGIPADHDTEISFVERFKKIRKLDYDLAVTADQSVQRDFGALALPTAVIIDRKGIIRYIEAGSSPSRFDDMQKMIVKLLAER
jgi:thiol-disulfide isomerase/thioredoxin